ncbi:hypothetical protein MMC20_003904 [Loxospora ochrophaea]|nr:hypothetical protein [Loxospora ochrophaea]
MNGTHSPQTPVTVSLKDLQEGLIFPFSLYNALFSPQLLDSIPFSTLEEAFGPSSLGILLVSDLAPNFHFLRENLLSYASHLAQLPPDILSSLTSPISNHLTGWSHGVETLKSGRYDTHKGSYYVNCAFYHSPALQCASPPPPPNPQFPQYTTPNVWPPESLLPGFRRTFEALTTLIIDTAVLVARACDRYAAANGIPNYEAGYLERVVKTSTTTKARLLHYFPPDISDIPPPSIADREDDSWCATHLDHGCLTGLTSALYIPEPLPSTSAPTVPLPSLPSSPDPAAGLYICSRTGTTTKVSIPPDQLAFQTGETLELVTGGRFRAVPHFVKSVGAGTGEKVSRNTLAVFTQPDLGEVVDGRTGLTFGEFAQGVVKRFEKGAGKGEGQ